jgi:CBS domain containing-hemolysin-like protein
MRAFYMATKPLVDLFNAMGNLVPKPFGVPPASEAGSQPHSEDELRELLRESSREGLIERAEQELSEAALIFGDMRAREVMKPRGEIDWVVTTDDPSTIAHRVIETGRTRLPVCEPEHGLDATVGTINAKDLLPLIFDDTSALAIPTLTRPAGHVSDSARVDEVLREMREKRVHLALVHDEHGTVIGLLTMEDILEELVGEIEDEFDPERADLIREEAGRLVVEGQAPIRPVAERLGVELEAHHDTTVGGYLSEQLARLPEVGESFECLGHRFEVLGVEETRISAVAIHQPTSTLETS